MSRSGQLWMDEVERILEEFSKATCKGGSGDSLAEARERALGKLVSHGFTEQEAEDQLTEALA